MLENDDEGSSNMTVNVTISAMEVGVASTGQGGLL